MTNAHVVAGVNDPEVLVGDSKLGADVVYYNKDLDVAVLKVPGLERPRLAFDRSEEHTSELQSLMRISYAVFCLNKNTNTTHVKHGHQDTELQIASHTAL